MRQRDYAILLLLVDLWAAGPGGRGPDARRHRLEARAAGHPERKAGHSTAFPLSATVGEALVDYLKDGRPQTTDRHVFFRAFAPLGRSGRRRSPDGARHYLLKAGVEVPRPGSHTLRHTTVQRLVDADFALKTIGDFVGHRSAASTEIYAKVAVEALREVALGDGEEVLA